MLNKWSAIIIVIFSLMIITGCSSSSTDGSYAGILKVNEKDYFGQGDIKDNEFTLGEKIGDVQKKVEKEVKPKEDFSSNFLEVGEEIYFSKEDSKVIIVKRKNGRLEKMTEEDYFKGE